MYGKLWVESQVVAVVSLDPGTFHLQGQALNLYATQIPVNFWKNFYKTATK